MPKVISKFQVILTHCLQLRNFVLTAYPTLFYKLPDPFHEGLKIKRLEEIREAPKIAAEVITYPLLKTHMKHVVDNPLHNNTAGETSIRQVCEDIESN